MNASENISKIQTTLNWKEAEDFYLCQSTSQRSLSTDIDSRGGRGDLDRGSDLN